MIEKVPKLISEPQIQEIQIILNRINGNIVIIINKNYT